MASDAKSLLVLWHLASLDAPTVAALWTWFIARGCHIQLSWVSIAAMAAAVWMLYAADRLLDAHTSDAGALEERHYFHRRHRSRFLMGIAIASVLLAVLLPRIPQEAIRLYLILGGMVFGYFVMIHATDNAHRLPKEIAVGICFAAAVFIPTVSRNVSLRIVLLPPAILFASLCSLNCLFIYAWEHPTATDGPEPHAITRFALRHLASFGGLVCIASAVMSIASGRGTWMFYAATGLGAAALLIINAVRARSNRLALRALADVALLTPALLIPFL